MARRRQLQAFMSEPIRMIGYPDLIVTRATAYRWLAEHGYSTNPADGFASVDWMVCHPEVVDLPLADDDFRACALAVMAPHTPQPDGRALIPSRARKRMEVLTTHCQITRSDAKTPKRS